MVGERLDLPMMRNLLDDAKEAGVNRVRLYGGEPMLHPDLPDMIRHSQALGMDTYLTSNATLLEDRIDELWDAGLRWMTIGFYGIDAKYDGYTQRKGHYEKLRRGLEKTRAKYGDEFEMQLNFVLIRSTCNLSALQEAWEFPECFPQSLALVRSVTDWLMRGDEMRVPCDAYQLLWVGADGTVQLCDVTFKLGNLHDTRLKTMLFGSTHRQACRDGFQLKCPNCTCKSDSRILKHRTSIKVYGGR
jgi:cyclic pyranopterin phosphate synthase